MIKNKLKNICELEADIYKRYLEINNLQEDIKICEKQTKEGVLKQEANIAKKKQEKEEIKKCLLNTDDSLIINNKKKIISKASIAVAITIISEILFYWLFTSAFGSSLSPAMATVIMVILYLIIATIKVAFESYTAGFDILMLIVAIVLSAIVSLSTLGYFSFCEVCLKLKTGGASILFMCLLILIEIVITIFVWINDDNSIDSLKAERMMYKTKLSYKNNEIGALIAKRTKYILDSKVKIANINLEIKRKEKEQASKKTELKALYRQSELQPKYYNWVAAATIYEYLDTGRCYKLKGPYGAYNIYEQELLAKKIAGNIDELINKESGYNSQVSNSQMYIRKQLERINENI